MAIFDPTEKPDLELWKKQSAYLDLIWKDALSDMAIADNLYFGTNNIWAAWEALDPSGGRRGKRPNLHSGRARALIDQAVASNLALEPDWVRLPVGKTKDNRAHADALENGMRAVFKDALTTSPILPTRANGKQLLLHNYTQLGVFIDESSLDKPVKKSGENKEDFQKREWEWWSRHGTWNPIRLEVPNPGEVFMPPNLKHPPIALRRKKMKAYEIAALLAMRTERKQRDRDGRYADAYAAIFDMVDKDAYQDIEIEEWWSASWYAMMRSGGDMLLVEPNGFGVQPFAQCWGGSAVMPTNEIFNLRWWVQQSFMHQEKDALVMLDQAAVAHHNLLQRKAWARLGTAGDTAELAENLLGDYLQGEKDTIWLEQTPELGAQSFQHLQFLQESIEHHTYSPMNVGFRQPGVDTATGILTLSEAGHRTFRDAQVQMEGLWSIGGSNFLLEFYKMAQELGSEFSTIARGEHTLDVEDMEERFHIEARFEQVDAAVAMQERIDARIDLEAGRLDEDTFFKIARYEDAEGIRRRRYRDMIYRDPDVIEQGVINALREEGMRELAEKRQGSLDTRRMQRTLVDQNGTPLMGPSGAPIMRGVVTSTPQGIAAREVGTVPRPPQNPLGGGGNNANG